MIANETLTQLVLMPELPDTGAMIAETKAKLAIWLDILNEEYGADRISQREWLAARNEVWDWDSKECTRIDQLYCDFHTEQAVRQLTAQLGEDGVRHLMSLLETRIGGVKGHDAALREMAKRVERGAGEASLIAYVQGLPSKH